MDRFFLEKIIESNKKVIETKLRNSERIKTSNELLLSLLNKDDQETYIENDTESINFIYNYEMKMKSDDILDNERILVIQDLIREKFKNISKSFKIVSLSFNESFKELTILFLSDNSDIKYESLSLSDLTIESLKLIETFNNNDSYEYWVYPKDIENVSNPTFYNCPNESYANLLMKSDPFLGKDRYKYYNVGKLSKSEQSKLLYVMNDPIYNLSKNFYTKPQDSILVNPVIIRPEKRNVLLIFFDQFNAYSNLPSWFTDQLPGYQAFRKRGIEFTSMYNNRQMCSPSRSVYMTGKIDTGLIDNVDQNYQYDAVGNLDKENTSGHMFKKADYDVTAYYGKSHFDSRMAPGEWFAPRHNISTTGAMKSIGFDRHGEFGDDFYEEKHAYKSDDRIFEKKCMIGTVDEEVYDIEINGEKFQGMLPFLKARNMDNKSFHAQFHFTNPHDIMHVYHNPYQTPNMDVMSLSHPFYEEQVKEFGNNVMYYSPDNINSSSKNENFNINFFEDNYEDYKNNVDSLLYKESFLLDYPTDTQKYNSKYSFIEGYYYGLENAFTIADQSQVVFWKNFQNTYLSMIKHTDSYLLKIYNYLENNNMFENTAVVICADHGEMCASHGLKQKGLPYKNSTNVPLIICSPDLDSSLVNTKNDKIVNAYDLNNTMASLGMIEYPNTQGMVGTSMLYKNANNKLVINKDIKDENIGIINNWMSYQTVALYYANDIDPTNLLDPLSNPLKYSYSCSHYLTKIDGVEYNYIIWWNVITIIKNQIAQFDIKKVISSIGMNLFNLITELEPELLNLPKSILNVVKEVFSADDILSLLDKLDSANKKASNLVNILLSFILLGLIPAFRLILVDNVNLENVKQTLKNKRSVQIRLELPFNSLSYDEMKDKTKDNLFLEMLFNRNEDPNEIYNLMDPKYPSTVESNKNIAKTLFNKTKNKAVEVGMDYTKTPIANTFGLNIINFITNKLNVNENHKLNKEDKTILMGMCGNNNMDSPQFENTVLKMITGNHRDPKLWAK